MNNFRIAYLKVSLLRRCFSCSSIVSYFNDGF